MAGRGTTRTLSVLIGLIGVVLVVAGGVTWYMVYDQLSAENIVVSDDADMLAGDDVDGPYSAYAQADIINEHALEASGGQTYAELERDDPLRETAMSASFLRASLFTSVVAFGVAAMAIALGVALVLIAWALSAATRVEARSVT
jgi:hypothetical protein